MRTLPASLLACLWMSACGGDDDPSPKPYKANPSVRTYCVAQCTRIDECGIENALFEGDDCKTVCEALTGAFSNCNPSKSVLDKCVSAIEQQSCDAIEANEEPAACNVLCE